MSTEQNSLFGAAEPVARLEITRDYGQVEKGASHAHCVRAENGEEYLIKGPRFTPDMPTVAGNEWVAAEIARGLGLPSLPHEIVTFEGDLFFASAYMLPGTWAPQIDKRLFGLCSNRERVYDVVVFDAWLINCDRHNENLPVRVPRRESDDHLLVLNDHSHLLVCPCGPRTADQLPGRLDASPGSFVTLPFVRDSIRSADRLRDSLDKVEAMSRAYIGDAVASTPGELLPSPYREEYARFLIERRSRLRRLFANHREEFPNLEGDL